MDAELKLLLKHIQNIDEKLSRLLEELSASKPAPLSEKIKPPGKSNDSNCIACDNPQRGLIPLAEFQQLSGIPIRTLYNWISKKAKSNPLGFSPIRAGKKIYFRRSDVDAFLSGSK